TASMSVRKSSHGTIFLIVSGGSPRALIASSLRSTSKKPFCPITRPLHPPMTAHGHRVRFVATWREEFFEVPRCHFRGIAGAETPNWGTNSVAIEINGYTPTIIDSIDINGFHQGVATPDGGALVKNARIEMVDYGIDGANFILENLGMEANFQSFLRLGGSAVVRDVFGLADGWENNNAGVTNGIEIGPWANVHMETLKLAATLAKARSNLLPAHLHRASLWGSRVLLTNTGALSPLGRTSSTVRI